jgi:hypothetical protein
MRASLVGLVVVLSMGACSSDVSRSASSPADDTAAGGTEHASQAGPLHAEVGKDGSTKSEADYRNRQRIA